MLNVHVLILKKPNYKHSPVLEKGGAGMEMKRGLFIKVEELTFLRENGKS